MKARALAAAQTIPAPGDVAANVDQHARIVERAAQEGALVVAFPELSLTGYELGRARELAFTEDDARLGPIIETATSSGITLIVGAPVRLRSDLHIGAWIVAPDGSVSLYTKRHLGEGEDTVFRPGTRDPLLPVGQGVGAVAVCADANWPSHPREAAGRGAATYLVCTFITPSELAAKTTRLRAYAREHAMTVVFSNYGGPSGGMDAGGRSAIWSESGEALARLNGVGLGLVVAIETATGWTAKAIELDGQSDPVGGIGEASTTQARTT